MSASDFTKLTIWKRSMDLAENVYNVTKTFPKEEMYGLSSLIRRAVVSISSNVAEGSQRHSRKDFANFISIAKGSLAEVQTQLILAQRLHYVTDEVADTLLKEIDEISRMLHGFYSQLIPHTS